MAFSPAVKLMLKALSDGDVEINSSRHFADIKSKDPLRILKNAVDYYINTSAGKMRTRIYFPEDYSISEDEMLLGTAVMVLIHGGGWATDSVDNYDRISTHLANQIGFPVISLEYRLAPENRFPAGLNDCYEALKCIMENRYFFKIDKTRVTLIGDSAGGNLSAALSLMARDKGEFTIPKQILIYPVVDTDHSETSPYPSVLENGKDYLLTATKITQYTDLYRGSPEDDFNPYFAPIKSANLKNQPSTLVLTASYDPLRDEGEAYAARLAEAGNYVEMHRIDDTIHGFFALGITIPAVKECFGYIEDFLNISTGTGN